MTTAGERLTSVDGELNYLAPGSTLLRRFTAPGASVNTGSYERQVVPIRGGRVRLAPSLRNFHQSISC